MTAPVTTAVVLLLSIGAGGCLSWVAVEKIPADDTTSKGIRYALPTPFVIVKPRPDGGVDVDVEYVPDPDNQYTVRSWSLVSKYTLDVTLDEKGLLKAVSYKPDNTGVAAQLVQSGGNVAKARLEASAAAEQTRAERVSAAQTQVGQAEGELRAAEAELRRLVELAATGADVADRIVEAEVKVAVARANVESARRALAASRGSAYRAPGDKLDKRKTDVPNAWGPVLYRVVEDVNGVKLEAVGQALKSIETQQRLETSQLPAVPAPPHPDPGFAIAGSAVIRPDAHGDLRFKAVSNQPIEKVDNNKVRLFQLDAQNNPTDVTATYKPITSRQPSGVSVIVDLDSKTPAGNYRLDIVYSPPWDPATPVSGDVRFTVRRP